MVNGGAGIGRWGAELDGHPTGGRTPENVEGG